MGRIKQFFSRIIAKDERGRDFSSEEQLKSQVSRSENQNKKKILELQKLQLDEQKDRLDRMKMQIEQRRIENQIADIEEELYDEDDEDHDDTLEAFGLRSEDAALLSGAYNLLTKAGIIKSPVINSPNPQTVTSTPDVTDEEILDFVNRIPKPMLKVLKKQSDDELKNTINSQVPGQSEHTVARAMELIKNV
jgi:hypothetical protein